MFCVSAGLGPALIIILRVGIFVMQTLCPYGALVCLLITLFRWHIALWLVDIWQECFLGEVSHKFEFTHEIWAEFNSMIWTLCFAVSLTINTMGIRCFDMRTRSFSLMSGALVFFFCFFLWSVRSYCYTLWKLYKNPNVDCPISCVACFKIICPVWLKPSPSSPCAGHCFNHTLFWPVS